MQAPDSHTMFGTCVMPVTGWQPSSMQRDKPVYWSCFTADRRLILCTQYSASQQMRPSHIIVALLAGLTGFHFLGPDLA